VPIPAGISFDNEQFHKANAYLPVIGAGVALVMATLFYLSQVLFSLPVSLILMLIGSLLLTGALHEDGFADCCDGLGGGYNVTQRLKIMKDSQIGSYAGIGLIVLFLLKLNLLIEIATIGYSALFIALLISHVLSRYGALCLMQSLPYIRLENGGKVKGLATRLTRRYFIFASLCTASVLLLVSLTHALFIITITAFIIFILRHLFIKNLEGYTGDCLGFTQQCIELTLLLLLTVLLVV
jgi:adenosylcobinamide-GDP ribazoletransferase